MGTVATPTTPLARKGSSDGTLAVKGGKAKVEPVEQLVKLAVPADPAREKFISFHDIYHFSFLDAPEVFEGASEMGVKVDALLIKKIECGLTTFVWDTFKIESKDLDPFVVDAMKNKPVTMLRAPWPHGGKLMFAGPVTTLRCKQSFKVATVLDIDFYMQGSCVSTMGTDVPVPAWMVQITESADDANLQMMWDSTWLEQNVRCWVFRDTADGIIVVGFSNLEIEFMTVPSYETDETVY